LNYEFNQEEKRIIFFNQVIKLLTRNWITLFLRVNALRIFGAPPFPFAPLKSIVIAQLKPNSSSELKSITNENAIPIALLGGKFEMVETFKLLDAFNYVFPNNPLSSLQKNLEAILKKAFTGKKVLQLDLPETFTDEIVEQLESVF